MSALHQYFSTNASLALVQYKDFDSILTDTTYTATTRQRYEEIREHVVVWSIIDGFLFVSIVAGNCLTIAAVQLSRRLRSVVSNLFILSLAISDLLVGLTIPYHLAIYLDVTLGESHLVCIMKFFFNIVACCVSIWNLIAIAIDRYIAIVYPLHYSRWITKRTATIVITFGWVSGTVMGVIPLFWNNLDTSSECEFDEVLPPWYMAGIVTPVFSLIWFCMLTLYWRIWREAYKHAKQLRASISGPHENGHSDWKSVQVGFFVQAFAVFLAFFSIWQFWTLFGCFTIFFFGIFVPSFVKVLIHLQLLIFFKIYSRILVLLYLCKSIQDSHLLQLLDSVRMPLKFKL